MGRNKGQSLIDELYQIEELMRNNDFERALTKLDKISQGDFFKNISKEEMKTLLSFLNSSLSLLKEKEMKIKEVISNSIKVKNTYLK
ncbi:MAG: hypothetical protein DSZ26_01355 [Thermovibrio sp.]|nr:MAG: hypothetical protein DSZ26_01355 [Thermovibrio sp.]